ncbi:MAG: hypothetical protein K2Z81_00915, partial [Cyanobacteria bacterium]|nr:hypothetical protein [Cyanobacteriota bacterium]
MTSVIPRHVICVLGNWRDFDLVKRAISRVGDPEFELDPDYSQLSPDERMVDAFEASYDRVSQTMTEKDWKAIREHSAVAYILSPPLVKGTALDLSGKMLSLTAALLHDGGVAAKSESAGIAHGRDQWLELNHMYDIAGKEADEQKKAATLYWSWVRRPLLSDREKQFYSCGMHLLGETDIEIDSTVLDEAINHYVYL